MFIKIKQCCSLRKWKTLTVHSKNNVQSSINITNKYCLILDEYVPKLHKLQTNFNHIINVVENTPYFNSHPNNLSQGIDNLTKLINNTRDNLNNNNDLNLQFISEIDFLNSSKPPNRRSHLRSLSLNYYLAIALINQRKLIHNQFLIFKLTSFRNQVKNVIDQVIINEISNNSPNFHNFTSINIPKRIQQIIDKGPSFIPTNPSEDSESAKLTLHKSILLSLKKLASKEISQSNIYKPSIDYKFNFRLYKKSTNKDLNSLLFHPKTYKNTFSYIQATVHSKNQ